ncbi:protein virilizer homolog isoform X1 [Salvia splendens]|uniref:protein virilizer homolog isoform X1 n=1 Tax=Salvia splendens TaxID=180675 RepID=UPI001C27E7AB|nr:protein virilizer homolog isoform X1 [Salvia splendens]XP_042045918.1 protein virilizer homolog isoform X1 [Salvia splendens]XP_042045919.1 protein virilizer homolog isoform X1 [Salvia splendens]
MGRPDPGVLYAHTFVHPHLDEYVDEVIFLEPVIISACEFLEQNASSICPAVKLMGATSPPSFALEVFVQCEGEARFRRLCLPCLYSHSSSTVLEVEAVVTNHLVVRGSYRSLSMVIYGNTAEDLGQFNIGVDLDSSLTDTISTVEGNLEDLPPAFHSTMLTMEELVSPLKILSQAAVKSDLPLKLRKFLLLVFRILDSQNVGLAAADNVISALLSVASTYRITCSSHNNIEQNQLGFDGVKSGGDTNQTLTDAEKELLDLYKMIQNESRDPSTEASGECLFLESEEGFTSKELMDTLQCHFDFCSSTHNVGYKYLSQNKNAILWSIVALLLCSTRESCFHFVSSGGMKQLVYILTHRTHNSTSLTLLLLGVIEQATMHSVGCEALLGWWPREDENIPAGTSDGYNQILNLLLNNQRHDVASLATAVLQRIRFYEIACRSECAVLSVLRGITTDDRVTNYTSDLLVIAKVQLKKLLNLMKLSGPVEDPSPMAAASRSLILGDTGSLAYKATSSLINLSSCRLLNSDIDSHLLAILKERGFLPLAAALLSSPLLRSETGDAMHLFLDIVLNVEAIILSLLFCRSGVDFLLRDQEVSLIVIRALRGIHGVQNGDFISLRYASVLLSRGFFVRPRDVGMIVEMHMRAVIAVDRLCKLAPNTEEFLWVLWDICRLSRSECGRQALLVLVNFPEAFKVLITALHSGKELEPVSPNTGVSPLNLAIFYSTAEILEVVVTDSTATSLTSWIDHAKEMHAALHSSSPGSNKKDAPARLLEWIDAGVVYHKKGAIGLLRYAAVLASGGDVHMASDSVLASDMMDVDDVVGDSSTSSDGNIVDNLLGKRITEKDFPGVILRDTSIAQLTTAIRILAFISENSVAATALYNEGAVMVIHAIMINCKLMLERSSNIYDYLVDEGGEGNSSSDLLLERNREKSMFDLLIPSLVLLINLLQELQESKEQHRNTKLMNVLLQLHREVSPKLAACGAELYSSFPEVVLGFGAVCHLIASALACWPVYSWTPGLFRFVLDSLHATSLLALGPKETCSVLCLLNDLLPDESYWLWKNGMPILSPLRAMAVGTLLGPPKEKQVNWYLRPGNTEKLIAQLSPQLLKLGDIILHCAASISVIVQEVLRVFVIRIACLNIDYASQLVKPIVSWISHRLLEQSVLSDVDAYKVNRLLKFLAILLEHPNAKPLLLKEGGFQMLTEVLERCTGGANFDVKQFPGNINLAKYEFPVLSWCIPVFQCLLLISDGRTSLQYPGVHERSNPYCFTVEECSTLWIYILRFCMVLPVATELVTCLSAFKEMASSAEGRNALLSIVKHAMPSAVEDSENQIKHESNTSCGLIYANELKENPPLLCCWTTLLKSIDSKDVPAAQVASAIYTLASGALGFCIDGESLNRERVSAIKFLFGVREDSLEDFSEENLKQIEELISLLEAEASYKPASENHPIPYQIKEIASLLMLLMQKSSGTEEADAEIARRCTSLLTPPVPSRVHRFADRSMELIEDYGLDEFGTMFSWECPENMRNRMTQTGLSTKRKISSLEGPNRHGRGENSVVEAASQSTFSRGMVPVTTPPAPTRRDTFRQRKPNTSRPPSMHVDDYVARERNADGTNSSNVIAVPRIGSASGRPPSVHVDVFMARQRERQNVAGVAVNEVATLAKMTAPDDNLDGDKSSKPQQLKSDLEDDLQGIDIVFDAEEAEPDDKLPFPQPDDNLPQPPSVIEPHSPPHSIVEETESDVNESNQFSHLATPSVSNMDENTLSEYSSRMSASRPEMPLTREPSISSDKKFPEPDVSKGLPIRTPLHATEPPALASTSGGAASIYMKVPSSAARFPPDPRMQPHLYSKPPLQQSGPGLQSFYDQKFPMNQPPLPLMPPPSTFSSLPSQNMLPGVGQSSSFGKSAPDVQTQGPQGFHVQSDYMSEAGNSTSASKQNSKFGRTSHSSPAGSTRPPPPLPPTPPLYSGNPSMGNSTSQSPQYFQPDMQQNSGAPLINLPASHSMLNSYPPPSMQPLLFRPGSMPVNLYVNNLAQQHGDNMANVSHNLTISMPLAQPIPTPTQLQPLQPPQIPRPPPPHLRPSVASSPQSELAVPMLHGSLQIPAHPSQMLQQQQLSPGQVYYQVQQQDTTSQAPQQQQQRVLQQPGETSQQLDSGISLQEFFKSPEAIQSLLSDRDKLCQLLEQHPKLMQMLQERLGPL